MGTPPPKRNRGGESIQSARHTPLRRNGEKYFENLGVSQLLEEDSKNLVAQQ